jgi:PAS domain S-box-containing protein
MLRLIALLYCLSIITNAVKARDTLKILSPKESYNLEKFCQIYEDKTTKLSLKAVQNLHAQAKFKSLLNSQINLPVGSSAYWLHFTVQNPHKINHFVLHFSDPTVYTADLYLVDDKGNQIHEKSGAHYPAAEKALPILGVSFMLELAGNTTYQVYIRIISKTDLHSRLSLLSEKTFQQKILTQYLIFGFFYGFVILILIYNLILYFASGFKAWLYLSGFAVCVAIIAGSFDGFTPHFLHFLVRWTNGFQGLYVPIVGIIVGLFFMLEFLEIKQNSTLLPRIANYLTVISFILLILIAIFGNVFFNWLILFLLILLLFHFWALIAVWKLRKREAVFYLTSLVWFTSMLLLNLGRAYDLLESVWFTQYSLHMGLAGMLMIFSVGLSDKITQLRKRLSAQILDNQRITSDKNKELEALVEMRTQALASQEANLFSLLESANDVIYSIDCEYRLLTFNSHTRKFFLDHYEFEPQVGMKLSEVVPSELFSLTKPLLDRALQNEYIKQKDKTVYKGKTFYREMYFNPIKNKKGEVTGVSVFSDDVSEEEQMKESLAYNQKILETIFDESPDALFLINPEDYQILKCNKKGLEMFEANNEADFIGKRGFHFHKITPTEAELQEITDAINSGKGWAKEYQYKTLKNNEFFGALKIINLKVNDQTLQLIRISDITEKKLIEQKIIENELNLQTVLESYDSAIWMVNNQLQILAFNRSFARSVFKTTGKQLEKGKNLLEYYKDPAIIAKWENIYKTALAGESISEIQDFQNENLNLILEVKAYPIYRNHQIMGVSIFTKDITKEKKFEKSLQTLNEHLEGVLKSTQDIVFAIDCNYNYLFFNETHRNAMKNIYGVDIQIDTNILDYMQAQDDAQKAKQDIDRALKGEAYIIEQIYGNTNIQRAYFEASYNPIINEDGEITGVAVFVRDISERKIQEQIIIEKEANLRAILENNDHSIWLIDRDYKLIDFNRIFINYYQYYFKTEPVAGLNILTNKNQQVEIQNFWKEKYDAVFEGQLVDFTATFPYKKQNLVFRVKIFPIKKDQNIIGASVFSSNITSQVESERELRSNQQLLASINQHIKEGLYRSTPTEGLIYANNAFLEMFGYNYEEIAESDLRFLYANPNERDHLLEIVDRKGSVDNEEILFRRKDGSVFWGLVSTNQNLTEQGDVYYDGSVRDITDVKKTERKLLQQNEILKKVNHELDKFVYSASHDLRAPLSSIMGLIEITKLASSEEERNKYIDLMLKSAKRLDDFIQQIVHYSRNSRLAVNNERIDFEELINLSFDNLKYMPNSELVERMIHINLGEPFQSDSFRLGVIFNNLISNAIRYTNPYQDKPYIEITISTDSEKAIIQIKDNGQGIDEQYLPHIFQMFYKANSQNTGSGLGLYIVKETLEVLKGSISVESVLGEGTTFTVKIPNIYSQSIENTEALEH